MTIFRQNVKIKINQSHLNNLLYYQNYICDFVKSHINKIKLLVLKYFLKQKFVQLLHF